MFWPRAVTLQSAHADYFMDTLLKILQYKPSVHVNSRKSMTFDRGGGGGGALPVPQGISSTAFIQLKD